MIIDPGDHGVSDAVAPGAAAAGCRPGAADDAALPAVSGYAAQRVPGWRALYSGGCSSGLRQTSTAAGTDITDCGHLRVQGR